MKYLFLFLLGAACGVFGYIHFVETPRENARHTTHVEKPHDATPSSPTHIDQPLSASSIKDELSRTGQVVRRKAGEVGATLASATHRARIATVINAKYTLDRDLSSRTIDVDVAGSKVTLRGTVASAELIARAITLALDTDGVSEVVSQLTVETP